MGDITEKAMMITAIAGDARASCMEAIKQAKSGDFDEARKSVEAARKSMIDAHDYQMDLIRKEMSGESQELSILMVHAQDHVTMATIMRDVAEEFICLYEKIYEEK